MRFWVVRLLLETFILQNETNNGLKLTAKFDGHVRKRIFAACIWFWNMTPFRLVIVNVKSISSKIWIKTFVIRIKYLFIIRRDRICRRLTPLENGHTRCNTYRKYTHTPPDYNAITHPPSDLWLKIPTISLVDSVHEFKKQI